jgi:hypothetical protein
MHFVRYSVVSKGKRESRLGRNLPQHSLAKYLLEPSNNAYLEHMYVIRVFLSSRCRGMIRGIEENRPVPPTRLLPALSL